MWNQEVTKKSVKQIKLYLRFFKVATLLPFSQPASWVSHLECISFNRCALLKVNLSNFFLSLMHLRQSVVLWQGRGGTQIIALFGKRPRQYYDKKSSNKQRATTFNQYFKTWRSVNAEHFKNVDSFFKCSHKNHQALWWNWLSWRSPQERKTQT